MGETTKQNIQRVLIYIVLFIGVVSFLDEFSGIRDDINLVILSLALTTLIIFIWEKIIKRILNRWF